MAFLYNQRVKKYPNGLTVVTTFNLPVFGSDESREVVGRLPPDKSNDQKKTPVPSKREDNVKRAKDKIFDIAFMNRFDYFVTLTFDPSRYDSSDSELVNKIMRKWFNNMVNRHSVRYLAVPELHKSGRIHWHLLLSGDVDLIDSETVLVSDWKQPIKVETAKKYGFDLATARTVYNLKNWRYGFSTAVRFRGVDDGADGTSAIAKYITKYITKNLDGITKHLYYAGGNLVRDVPTEYYNVPFDSVEALERSVDGTGLCVKYQTIGGRDNDSE